MALSAGESFSGGQVRDSKSRSVVISETTNAAVSAGEFYSAGFLCDPDSRTVICQDTVHSALVAGETLTGGDVRDKFGRIACAVETLNAPVSAGSQFSDGWLNDSQGRRIIALDTLGAALGAGEQFTSGQLRDSVGRLVLATETAAGSAYDAAVLADSPLLFYEMKEPSGTIATDSSGNAATGTYQGTVTLAQPGPCSDGETAALFNGTTGYLSTPNSFLNPSPWSVEIWFKTANAYASGGALFSFNSTATGVSGSFDRELAMDNAGIIRFGSDVQHCVSAGALNNGAWHHAVGTFDPVAGQNLYVDGALAQNSVVTNNNNYTGWWRFGNASSVASWGASTSPFIAGTLAKAAVYNVALTLARVQAHYAAR